MNHNKKRIRCLETGAEYESITAAAKAFNCGITLIWKALNGYTKTSMGYHWDYV